MHIYLYNIYTVGLYIYTVGPRTTTMGVFTEKSTLNSAIINA